jgi:predicted TIM-barrel enzyme
VVKIKATRKQIIKQLKNKIRINKHIIGVSVGSGMSARHVRSGGADIILAANAGKYREMGVSSTAAFLPIGNSNSLVMEFGCKEIIPLIRDIPVIFALCATDPNLNIKPFWTK